MVLLPCGSDDAADESCISPPDVRVKAAHEVFDARAALDGAPTVESLARALDAALADDVRVTAASIATRIRVDGAAQAADRLVAAVR